MEPSHQMQADGDPVHPTPQRLRDFVLGELDDGNSEGVEHHLKCCEDCCEILRGDCEDDLVALLREVGGTKGGGVEFVSPSASIRQRLAPGYALLEVLGEGGMGVVWKARQEGLNRIVALKRLRSSDKYSPEALARFRREAESVARLHHPNIVQIYEVGEQEGEPFLALEYVGGGTLAQMLAAEPIATTQAAALIETLALAIHHAHQHGIVHRDLKPGNVLVDENGELKIGDFGLAKQLDRPLPLPSLSKEGEAVGKGTCSQTGAILGTPSYMAPEQASGDHTSVGPAADVYALGAILYESLTGRPPFRGPSVSDTLANVRERDPVVPRQLQPSVPHDLQTICLKCLNKVPGRRYRSALDLAEDLRRFLDGKPILARPVGLWERLLKSIRRKPYQAILVGIAFLVPLATVIGLFWHNERLRREIVRAEKAEGNSRDNYKKSRQTIRSMLTHLNRWYHSGSKNTAEMSEALTQDALDYVQTVLDNGDNSDPQVQADAAELLLQVARIQIYHGLHERASENFVEALRLWERVSEQCPN
jgi:serine/threonine protein kinase